MTFASPCMMHSRCRGKVASNATKSHYAQEQPSTESPDSGANDLWRFSRGSGGSQRKRGRNVWLGRGGPVALAAGLAGHGAITERLVDDGLDGARASAAFGAAAETSIDLLGIARQLLGCADGVADIVVAEDVAGTNNHENGRALCDA